MASIFDINYGIFPGMPNEDTLKNLYGTNTGGNLFNGNTGATGTNTGATNTGFNTGFNGAVNTGTNTGQNNVNYTGFKYTGQTFTPTNNMGTINQQSDAALKSTIDAIKAAVQTAKNSQNRIISKANEEYPRLKTLAYNQSLAGLPSIKENLANLGTSQQGGLTRTEMARQESGLQNRLNALEIEKQNVIDQANFEIANLEANGNMEEAQATAQAARDRLKMILDESARLDSMNYATAKDAYEQAKYADETAYARSRDSLTDTRTNDELEYRKLRDTIADTRYDKEYQDSRGDTKFNQDITEAGLTGTYNGNRILQAQQMDWDNQFKQGTFDYQKEQDKIANTRVDDQFKQEMELKLKQFTADETQQTWENTFKQGTFDYQKEQDKIANSRIDDQFKQEMQLKLDSFTQSEMQRNWENTYRENTFSYQQEQDKINNMRADEEFSQQMQLKLDEFAWSKSEDNPAVKAQLLDNQLKGINIEMAKIEKAYAGKVQAENLTRLKKENQLLTEQITAAKNENDPKMRNLLLNEAKAKVSLINAQIATEKAQAENYKAAANSKGNSGNNSTSKTTKLPTFQDASAFIEKNFSTTTTKSTSGRGSNESTRTKAYDSAKIGAYLDYLESAGVSENIILSLADAYLRTEPQTYKSNNGKTFKDMNPNAKPK